MSISGDASTLTRAASQRVLDSARASRERLRALAANPPQLPTLPPMPALPPLDAAAAAAALRAAGRRTSEALVVYGSERWAAAPPRAVVLARARREGWRLVIALDRHLITAPGARASPPAGGARRLPRDDGAAGDAVARPRLL